ncbi:MAG: 3-deoxy-8-phosphooctulonate synthase [Candidatus Sumerlaeota bacterium]
MPDQPIAPIAIGPVSIGLTDIPALIAGPCVIESRDIVFQTAERLKQITTDAGVPFIFKASYDKANRTSVESFRGPGRDEGLEILAEVKKNFDVPVLTDIHGPDDAAPVAEVVDCLQLPAFLCRQTDLLVAAGKTGKPVNVKKGQFMAPGDMGQAVGKIRSTGNTQVLLTERGASFGYNNLVVDMRGLIIMRRLGCPVVFDATHSVQLPGGAGTSSGGDREYAPALARAAAAVGIDALFIECHPCPDEALCDGPNSLHLDTLPGLLEDIKRISQIAREAEKR